MCSSVIEDVLSGTECMLNCCPTEFPYNVLIFRLDYYKHSVFSKLVVSYVR